MKLCVSTSVKLVTLLSGLYVFDELLQLRNQGETFYWKIVKQAGQVKQAGKIFFF